MKAAQGVADGSVTLAFRRWRKQDVQPGQVFTTSAGLVRVDAVTVVDDSAVTDDEARLAGWPNAERLMRRLAPEGTTYRIELSYAGPDPRIALRSSADLTEEDVADLDRRLERLDRASSHGPWTLHYLELIRQHPQRRAPDLWVSTRFQHPRFKFRRRPANLTRSSGLAPVEPARSDGSGRHGRLALPVRRSAGAEIDSRAEIR